MNTIDCPKCKYEHTPDGYDGGEWDCENCGFRFHVEVDYDPLYSTSCIVHEYGEWEKVAAPHDRFIECRFCIHCEQCELKPTAKESHP